MIRRNSTIGSFLCFQSIASSSSENGMPCSSSSAFFGAVQSPVLVEVVQGPFESRIIGSGMPGSHDGKALHIIIHVADRFHRGVLAGGDQLCGRRIDAIGITALSGQFFDGSVAVGELGVFLFPCHCIILLKKRYKNNSLSIAGRHQR